VITVGLPVGVNAPVRAARKGMTTGCRRLV
jgi:hypothetical protein